MVASLTVVTADSDARINFASAVAAQHIGSQDCSGDVQLGRDFPSIVTREKGALAAAILGREGFAPLQCA